MQGATRAVLTMHGGGDYEVIAALVRADTVRYAKVVKDIGLKMD